MTQAKTLIDEGVSGALQSTLNSIFGELNTIFNDLDTQISDTMSKMSENLTDEKIGSPIRLASWGIVLLCG